MINLHHATEEDVDIPKVEFCTLQDCLNFIIANSTEDVVYLISVFDEVFVTDHPIHIVNFIPSVLQDEKCNDDSYQVEIYLQEYESFEDAYRVALDMQEIKPLCYNKSI